MTTYAVEMVSGQVVPGRETLRVGASMLASIAVVVGASSGQSRVSPDTMGDIGRMILERIEMQSPTRLTGDGETNWDRALVSSLVSDAMKQRVALLVAGEGVASGFPVLDRGIADAVLSLAGELWLTLGRSASIAPIAGGGLELEVRLDEERELFVEIEPNGAAVADIDGVEIARAQIAQIGARIAEAI